MAADGVVMTDVDRPRESKVHHTVTACVRCRQRKTRCDPALPACEPCQRSNSHCEYFDSAKNRIVPRRYIVDLQDALRKLQGELRSLEIEEADEFEPDHESMARAPNLVKFSESDHSRFLGPSSGIGVTRFVMDFARRYADRGTIREVVSEEAAQEIKQTNDVESEKPTSKVYPLVSSVAAPQLPGRELMEQLLQLYNHKAQYMLPLLHEPSFRQDVDAVYNGSQDPVLNFQVRMVIAISMQKLDTQYAGLADSYYLAALPYLDDSIKRKDISTLQCFALIAQYSLLTPTRTAAFWVVGLAAKLCQDLGICDEKTIDKPISGTHLNTLEIDMRRRLFWIITSMEYGLSHSLGRPSAFGVSVDNINVGWFHLCDDRYITPDGLLPGHHPIMKKCIAIHFLEMRLLQAEIRRTLYLRKRETPLSHEDPWFQNMINSIDKWIKNTPKNDEGSGLSPAWFEGRKNTMVIMMYRPTPQIPKPLAEAAEKCYQAAVFNIGLQKKQVDLKLIDITWIFTQAIHMAVNTVLWSISYLETRDRHPLEEVQEHLNNGLSAIDACADRWPGVRSAHQLYRNLVATCLRAYDPQAALSPRTKSSPSYNGDLSTSASTSQIAPSPGNSTSASLYTPQSPQSYQSHPSILSQSQVNGQSHGSAYNYYNRPGVQASQFSNDYASSSPSSLGQSLPYSSPQNEMQTPLHIPVTTQPLPAWNSMPTTSWAQAPINYATMPIEQPPWLAPLASEYTYLSHTGGDMQYQMQSLNQQEQVELLATLERNRLPDISGLGGDMNAVYTPNIS